MGQPDRPVAITVNIDVNIFEHPKVVESGVVSPLFGWLHVSAICYCRRVLSDGHLTQGAIDSLAAPLRRLADEFGIPVPGRTAEDWGYYMAGCGLWDRIETCEAHGSSTCFEVHDYARYNKTRDQIEGYYSMRREAGRLGGLASGESRGAITSRKEIVEAGGSSKQKARGSSTSQAHQVEQVQVQVQERSDVMSTTSCNSSAAPPPSEHPPTSRVRSQGAAPAPQAAQNDRLKGHTDDPAAVKRAAIASHAAKDPLRMADDDLRRWVAGAAKLLGEEASEHLRSSSDRDVLTSVAAGLLNRLRSRSKPKPTNATPPVGESPEPLDPAEAKSIIASLRKTIAPKAPPLHIGSEAERDARRAFLVEQARELRAQIPRDTPAVRTERPRPATIRSGPIPVGDNGDDLASEARQELQDDPGFRAQVDAQPVDAAPSGHEPAPLPDFQPEPPAPHAPAGELSSGPVDLASILRNRRRRLL